MKPRAVFVAEIDQAELAVRMCEASYGLTRPPGLSANEALAAMDRECSDGWTRAAVTALLYVRECIAKGQAPS